MDRILEYDAELIVAGDMNASSTCLKGYKNTSTDGKKFEEAFDELDLQISEFPDSTFVSHSTKTFTQPDVLLHSDLNGEVVSETLDFKTIDHRPILTTLTNLDLTGKISYRDILRTRWNISKINYPKFLQSLRDSTQHCFSKIESGSSLTVGQLNAYISTALFRAAKKSTPRGAYQKRTAKVNSEIEELEGRITSIIDDIKNPENDDPTTEMHFDRLTTARQQLTQAQQNLSKTSLSEFITEKPWQAMNSLSKFSKKRRRQHQQSKPELNFETKT